MNFYKTPKRYLTKSIFVFLSLSVLTQGTLYASTRVEIVTGTVVDTFTLTSTYVRKIPTKQRVCRTEDVPIYAENKENSELGSMIIGGLIGSAFGNKMSDNQGAGAAGTVAGALIGREHAKKRNQEESRIVGYKQQEICAIEKSVREERIDEISGYRNQVEVEGEIIEIETKTPLRVGSRLELQRKTSYRLR